MEERTNRIINNNNYYLCYVQKYVTHTTGIGSTVPPDTCYVKYDVSYLNIV